MLHDAACQLLLPFLPSLCIALSSHPQLRHEATTDAAAIVTLVVGSSAPCPILTIGRPLRSLPTRPRGVPKVQRRGARRGPGAQRHCPLYPPGLSRGEACPDCTLCHGTLTCARLENTQALATDPDPPSNPAALHLLRTPAGQAFLCEVPPTTDEAAARGREQDASDSLVKEADRARGLERGLELLEPMRGSCLFLKQNWFTYKAW